MANRNHLPEDVKQACLWIVKGYSRRAKWYDEQKATATSAGELAAIEGSQEAKRMRAVEMAQFNIATDVEADGLRRTIREAVLMNCQSGRLYPFERLGDLGLSRSDFYRRKDKFLADVAEALGFM